MSEPEITVRYECSEPDGCPHVEGPLCPDCYRYETKVTRRALPPCDKYQDSLSQWARVWMQDTAEGQRFFHGTMVWEVDPEGTGGDMREVFKLTDQVPLFSEIHGCQQGNEVWFYVSRIPQLETKH